MMDFDNAVRVVQVMPGLDFFPELNDGIKEGLPAQYLHWFVSFTA